MMNYLHYIEREEDIFSVLSSLNSDVELKHILHGFYAIVSEAGNLFIIYSEITAAEAALK